MTDQTIEQVFNTEYIKPDRDDWFDIIMGTFVGMGIYGIGGCLLLMKLGLPKILSWFYIPIVLVIIIYLYWKDGQIKLINTGLTKTENRAMLKSLFSELGWSFHETSGKIFIGDNKYILKFIHARVFYWNNSIGYNFQYASSKSGRPFFLFGIRTYLKGKFEGKLKTLVKSG